jgi:hypothetical protein
MAMLLPLDVADCPALLGGRFRRHIGRVLIRRTAVVLASGSPDSAPDVAGTMPINALHVYSRSRRST